MTTRMTNAMRKTKRKAMTGQRVMLLLTATATALMMAMTAGCDHQQPPPPRPFDLPEGKPAGVPAGAELVGEGQDIEFTAPDDGFLYIVLDGQLYNNPPIAKNQYWTATAVDTPQHYGDIMRARHVMLYFEPATLKEPPDRRGGQFDEDNFPD